MRRHRTRFALRSAVEAILAALVCLYAAPSRAQQDEPGAIPPSADREDQKQAEQSQPRPSTTPFSEHEKHRFEEAGKTPDEVTMSHKGEFLRAQGDEFTMRSKGRQHSHTLSDDARVTLNGEPARLSDLRPGDQIAVTTPKTELGTALAVEATRDQDAARDRQNQPPDRAAWLGVMLRESEPEQPGEEAREQGAVVDQVYPSGPAARAGLRSGDVIVRIGEHKISQLDDLYQAMDQLQPKEEVEITVLRGGEKQKLTATLASRADFFGEPPFRGFRGEEFFGGEFPRPRDMFLGAPDQSMMLEQQRRLENLLNDVLDEVKQLRQEVQQLKEGKSRQPANP